jgi:hypothetical protein
MQVEALVCFLQVYVASLAQGYFESCALHLVALPAPLACAIRQPSVFDCRQRKQLRPKGCAKSHAVWSMLTNEQLTSIGQGSPATSAEPPNVSGGWQNLKDFP